jgi:hypothetical protein
MSSLPLGNTTDITGFSPADFEDAEDTRPLEVQMDITGTGSFTPYSQLANNVLQRHTTEIKEKSVNPAVIAPHWKRRFRDFMATRNEDLVNFLKKPLAPGTSLNRAEVFVKKFGRSDFHPTHPSLQTTFLDGSGGSVLTEIEEELLVVGPSTPKQIQEQVRFLYDKYREAGDDCLKHENALKLRLDVLDKTYQKIISFSELPVNEDTEQLAASVETYVKKIMEEHKIEEEYTKTVEAYRRFAALKETIQFLRFTELQDKEPLCSICLHESVTFALSPCGHTLCGTCMKRQMNTCYMCRTHIRERIKLYFG